MSADADAIAWAKRQREIADKHKRFSKGAKRAQRVVKKRAALFPAKKGAAK